MASGALTNRNAFVFQSLLQLTGLEHLAHDIAAADKLALDVKLRDRWPVRIAFDAGSDFVRFKNVDAFVSDTEMVENLNHLS